MNLYKFLRHDQLKLIFWGVFLVLIFQSIPWLNGLSKVIAFAQK